MSLALAVTGPTNLCHVCGGATPAPARRAGAPLRPTPDMSKAPHAFLAGIAFGEFRREAANFAAAKREHRQPAAEQQADSNGGDTESHLVVASVRTEPIRPSRRFVEAAAVAIPEELLRADRNRERRMQEGLRRHRRRPDSTLHSGVGGGGRKLRTACARH